MTSESAATVSVFDAMVAFRNLYLAKTEPPGKITDVSRISIELPPAEHQRLRALAALEGKTLEEFVLQRSLAAARGSDEEQAVLALEAILDERIRRAEAGDVSEESVSEVFENVYRETRF